MGKSHDGRFELDEPRCSSLYRKLLGTRKITSAPPGTSRSLIEVFRQFWVSSADLLTQTNESAPRRVFASGRLSHIFVDLARASAQPYRSQPPHIHGAESKNASRRISRLWETQWPRAASGVYATVVVLRFSGVLSIKLSRRTSCRNLC